MKVKILRDTVVRVVKGQVIDVTDAEAARLKAFGNGEVVEDKPEKTTKKGGK